MTPAAPAQFNVVSPGADPKLYFSYTEKDKRLTDLHPEIEELFFGQESGEARGKLEVRLRRRCPTPVLWAAGSASHSLGQLLAPEAHPAHGGGWQTSQQSAVQQLHEAKAHGGGGAERRAAVQDKEKPILFSMARLDTVKNLTGLAEWFGRNERLRKARPPLLPSPPASAPLGWLRAAPAGRLLSSVGSSAVQQPIPAVLSLSLEGLQRSAAGVSACRLESRKHAASAAWAAQWLHSCTMEAGIMEADKARRLCRWPTWSWWLASWTPSRAMTARRRRSASACALPECRGRAPV